MSAPLVKFAPLKFHCLLRWFGLFHRGSSVCSFGMLSSEAVLVSTTSVWFAPVSAPLFGLLHWSCSVYSVAIVCSVEVPLFAPLVRFAPLEFHVCCVGKACSSEGPLFAPLVWFAPLEFQCLLC